MADAEGKKIKITCAVVEEDKHSTVDQRKDADKYKVELRGTKPPRYAKIYRKPTVQWVDNSTATYYPYLVRENSCDFIIGHVPYLANGALNLKDIYPPTETKPKVILMIHDLPRTTSLDIDGEMLLDKLSEADIVFSIGKVVEAEMAPFIASLDRHQQPVHKLYIPGLPLELFNVYRDTVKGNKVHGTQNITMMIGDRKDVSGLNFSLAIASTFGASRHISDFDGVRSKFELLINNIDNKDQWKNEFENFIQKQGYRGRPLYFRTDAPETLQKLKDYLRKRNLFILPLKPDSSVFGAQAFSAVVAGVPILVSAHSGMASILEIESQCDSIIRE